MIQYVAVGSGMSDSVRLKIYRTENGGSSSVPIAVLEFVPREELLCQDRTSGAPIPAYVEEILAANNLDVLMIRDVTVRLPVVGSLCVNASYHRGNGGLSVLVKHDEKHVLSIGCLCSTEGTASQNNPYFAVLLQTGDFIEFFVDRE